MGVFDAPRGTGPYGIAATPDGQGFFASLAGNYLGQIDLDTGTVTVVEPPVPRQGARRVWSDSRGALWITGWNSGDLFRYDSKAKNWARWHLPGDRPQPYAVYVDDTDAVWVSDWATNAILRFDPKTEKFEVYIDQQANTKYDLAKPIQKDPNDPFPNLPIPQGTQSGGARSHTAAVDHEGNIWVSGRPLKKLDVRTGKYTYYDVDVPDSYGIAFDRVGNIWFAQFNSRDHQDIGMVDVKTDKITKFRPPAEVTPRRLKIDSKGMVWVGDYFGGSLTRFDPTNGDFKVFKLPGPMPTPYGLEVDHDDNVWYASMYTDVMGKLDPKTGKVTEYPSPYGERGTRDMSVDAQGRIWYGAQPYFKAGYVRVRTEAEKKAALGG